MGFISVCVLFGYFAPSAGRWWFHTTTILLNVCVSFYIRSFIRRLFLSLFVCSLVSFFAHSSSWFVGSNFLWHTDWLQIKRKGEQYETNISRKWIKKKIGKNNTNTHKINSIALLLFFATFFILINGLTMTQTGCLYFWYYTFKSLSLFYCLFFLQKKKMKYKKTLSCCMVSVGLEHMFNEYRLLLYYWIFMRWIYLVFFFAAFSSTHKLYTARLDSGWVYALCVLDACKNRRKHANVTKQLKTVQ